MKKLINLTMFDLLKGIIMLGVLFGHSIIAPEKGLGLLWYGKIMHSLAMAALFIVSGYWLKKKTIKAGVKLGITYLIKPLLLVLLIINVIGFVHRAMAGNLSEWVELFFVPSLLMWNGPGTRLGPLWFVLALFWAWCIFYFVVQITGEKLQIGIAVLFGVLGGALMPLQLPYQIAPGLMGFFFLYAGYFIKKKKLLEKKVNPVLLVLMLGVWWLTVVYGSMDFYLYDVKYGILSAIGSLLGAFLLIKLFLYVNLLDWRVLDAFGWVGRYSMWYMCIHSVEKAVFPWKILFRFVDQKSMIGIVALFILRTIMITVICCVCQKVLMYWNGRKLRG